MNIYTYILIGLLLSGLGYSLAKDGQPKEGEYSFFWTLLSTALWIFLIYMAVNK